MTPPAPDDRREPGAVAEGVTALGPFFALDLHPPGSPPAGPWQPVTRSLLDERTAEVGARLAAAGGQRPEAVELRVAASVAHLGLAARLVSPALAAAALYGRPLVFGLGDVRWQPVLGGPVPLSLPADTVGEAGTPERLADVLAAELLAGPLEELAAAFAVSAHIARGNTASAVNSAAAMIARARPGAAGPARALAVLLLARPPLAGESSTAPDGSFRRRSCCLIYRAAPDRKGALCGDCALR